MALTNSLCAPALIYLCFSLTQIGIDIFKKMYSVAFIKFWVMIIFSILLNTLCSRGLGIISWILVFIPFMLMSMVTLILVVVFGLNPLTGEITYGKKKHKHKKHFPPNGYRPSPEWPSNKGGGSINPDDYRLNDCKTFCGDGRECTPVCKKHCPDNAKHCEKEENDEDNFPFPKPSNDTGLCPKGCEKDLNPSNHLECATQIYNKDEHVGSLCPVSALCNAGDNKGEDGWCSTNIDCNSRHCVHKFTPSSQKKKTDHDKDSRVCKNGEGEDHSPNGTICDGHGGCAHNYDDFHKNKLCKNTPAPGRCCDKHCNVCGGRATED